MKVVTAPFTAMRTNTVIPGTKTRITISEYDDTQPIWTLDSDTDVTDKLLRGQPNIDSELEEGVVEFKTDSLAIDFEDEDQTLRNLIFQEDKYFLIKIEKGFDGIADWITIFDGIIYPYETIFKARNIASITAYSMEKELEYHPGSDSASSGGSVTLVQAVNDLLDCSYITIPGGNRTISVPGPYSANAIPLCDYSGWNVREALDNLARVYNCVWRRPERDTAMFVSRKYVGGTFNLDTDLYGPKFEHRIQQRTDGVTAENSALGISADSIYYVDGYNDSYNNQLLRNQCKQCNWSAEENYSFQRYDRRIFRIPAFYLLELEPLDRVNLTLRDKDGNLDETIFTQFVGSEYDDTNKITRLKLEERMPRVYEKYVCDYDSVRQLFGLTWQAQTYTIGTDGYNQQHQTNHVKLLMYRTGNPGNITVAIRGTFGGAPAGGDLCSVTLNANTFTAAAPGLWYQFDFTTSSIQAVGTQYAIVCRCPAGDAANLVNWQCASNASPTNYTGGSVWTSNDGGATWAFNFPDDDFMFECWGHIN